jgi:DNA-binding NarL/FixJ family response regulator
MVAGGRSRNHHRQRQPLDAAREMRAEVTAGRLDPAATDAVLAAAGHRPSRGRMGGPAGLTARESEVVTLLAQGLPNTGSARGLGISASTVGNHVERIWAKLGVSNRAGDAMLTSQHGPVGGLSSPAP